MEDGLSPKCEHIHTTSNSCPIKGVVLSIKTSFCLCPVGKEQFKYGEGVCVHMFACMYVHVSKFLTYHTWLCVCESSDVIVLMMIMMRVYIYQRRWKKLDGG